MAVAPAGLVIWDVDGTLVETGIDFSGLKAGLWQEVAVHGGDPPDDVKARPLEAALRAAEALDREGRTDGLAKRLWAKVEAAERAGERTSLLPGVKSALVRCRGAGLVSVALTNNLAQPVRGQFTALGVLPLLAAVYGRDDVPAMKPSPAGVEFVLARHAARSAAMIGNSWLDAAASYGAGIPFFPVQELRLELCAHGLPSVPPISLEHLPEAVLAAWATPPDVR